MKTQLQYCLHYKVVCIDDYIVCNNHNYKVVAIYNTFLQLDKIMKAQLQT